MSNIISSPLLKHYAALGFINYYNNLDNSDILDKNIKNYLYAFVGDAEKLTNIPDYRTGLAEIKKKIIFVKKIPASSLYLCIPKIPWECDRAPLTIDGTQYSCNFISAGGQEDAEYPKYSFYTSETIDDSGIKTVKVWKCIKHNENGIATEIPHLNEEVMYDEYEQPITHEFTDGYEWINEYTFEISNDWSWESEDYYPLFKTFSLDDIEKLPHFIRLIANIVVIKVEFVGEEKIRTLTKLPYAIPFHTIGIVKGIDIQPDFVNDKSYKCTYTINLNNCWGDFKTNINNTNTTIDPRDSVEFEDIDIIGTSEDDDERIKILSDVTDSTLNNGGENIMKTILCYNVSKKVHNYFVDKINEKVINRKPEEDSVIEVEKILSVDGVLSGASGEIVSVDFPEVTLDDAKIVYFHNMEEPVYRYKNESQTFYIGFEL